MEHGTNILYPILSVHNPFLEVKPVNTQVYPSVWLPACLYVSSSSLKAVEWLKKGINNDTDTDIDNDTNTNTDTTNTDTNTESAHCALTTIFVVLVLKTYHIHVETF